ncbi:drug/metabolite transporter (DMT)-like permease [Alkalihalobacillus xiaoxiensis]|uniref:Drug/metabolite transporter (DMT)-like permease n=1 Tax=Shouchella xiaoxiensis TaxID=766895 RepID=A0ABS2STI9_9BACI|nr:DMT family transporter [Shouchella xiaoxiensis]MBM7838840.1 drug/metabolite transporter (DMT)-like permease [Shouchella xiaoxiensis]
MKATWLYSLAVLIGGACFGILSTFVKLGYAAGASLTHIVLSQFVIGLVILGGMLVFTKRTSLSLAMIGKLLACGIPTAITGVFYYHSLQTLDASLAVIFLFQFVWIGSLYEFLFTRKRVTPRRFFSIIILIIGSIFAAGVLQTSVQFDWIGAGWALLSAFCSALFMYLTSVVGTDVPVVQKSFIISIGGLATSVLVFIPTLGSLQFSGLEPSFIWIALLLGFFGIVLPPLMFSIGMPKIGSGLGAILSTAELPVALFFSILLLQETVLPLQWFGVMIIFAGIFYGNVTRRSTRKDELNWRENDG